MKGLKKILIGAAFVTGLFFPNAAYPQMTGSTTWGSKQDPNFRAERKYTPEQQEQVIKQFRKFVPYGGIINPAIDGAEWIAREQNKRGYPTGTSSTTKNNYKRR
ncbi:hypothetical protein HY448_02845 [Candidatus Pacearchaeota archaeon]|nr:hypothetical protein [Candidatus Pacearchaeota archaeon]